MFFFGHFTSAHGLRNHSQPQSRTLWDVLHTGDEFPDLGLVQFSDMSTSDARLSKQL